MTTSALELVRGEAGIATVRLGNAAAPLTIDTATIEALAIGFQEIARDRDVRVLVLLIDALEPGDWDDAAPHEAARRLEAEIALARALIALPVPVLAAVRGMFAVQAELALLADLVLAADDATFGDARGAAGRVPAGAAAACWQAALGHLRADALLFGLTILTAADARAAGVVHAIAPRDALEALALDHAVRIARQPDLALRFTRRTMIRRLAQRIEDDAPLGLALSAVAAMDAAGWSPPAQGTAP